ncbi:hypothetical protein HZH66_002211 [Vespula vulgaris]|uniref:Uncharacterized protein n=1 Tax=Vespula vulgaris TaxID=7454 RepID=A0A834NH29_VESVU|nr:hypothetical protein HZH66_002211 [Vespula vulgaris]
MAETLQVTKAKVDRAWEGGKRGDVASSKDGKKGAIRDEYGSGCGGVEANDAGREGLVVRKEEEQEKEEEEEEEEKEKKKKKKRTTTTTTTRKRRTTTMKKKS